MKNVYDVEQLDLVKVAYSFGFRVPPVVDIGKRIDNCFQLNYIVYLGVYQSKKGSQSKNGFKRPKQERKMKVFRNLSDEKGKKKFTR